MLTVNKNLELKRLKQLLRIHRKAAVLFSFCSFFLCLFVCSSSSCTESHRVNTVAALNTGKTKAGWRRSRWQIGIAEIKPTQLLEAKWRRSHDCHWSGWTCPKGRGGAAARFRVELVTACHFSCSTNISFTLWPLHLWLQELEQIWKNCSKPFGIQINCYAAAYRSEIKQQYLTLGCLPEKVSAVAAAQIATCIWMETGGFIYSFVYLLKFCRTSFSCCSGSFATCAEGDSVSRKQEGPWWKFFRTVLRTTAPLIISLV